MSANVSTVSFDYTVLAPETAETARQAAGRIRRCIEGGFLAVGHDLLEVKALLAHGQFGAWLNAEFGLTRRSAERYMAAARFALAESDTVSRLLPGVVEVLAAPSYPPQARADVIARTQGGEIVGITDVRALAQTYKLARHYAKSHTQRRRPRTQDGLDKVAQEQAEALAREEREARRADRAMRELCELVVRALGADVGRAAELCAALRRYAVEGVLAEAIMLAAGGAR